MKKRNTYKLNAILMMGLWFISGGVAAVPSQAHQQNESAQQTTAEVWQHHIDAWVQRDLDAIVSDYTDESLMIVNNRIYRGQDEIRKVFEHLFVLFDEGSNRIDPAILDGRIIYITWFFTPTGDHEYFGTDTFVVEDGKIVVQTIASLLYEKHPVE